MTPAISERPQQDCLATTESEMFVIRSPPYWPYTSDKLSRSTTAWPLIHLAVTCSEEAYSEVDGSSAQPYTALKRIKITQRNARLHGQVVVVAVSGTRGLKDWMVNLKNNASEPKGVLGEKRNLCHTGFLETVRLLINPLALSLSTVERGLTLLFTGHSAGAAIASLLYAHVGTTKTSPLAKVAERFQSIHCIVFGAPPISIAPLQKKDHKSYSFRGSFYLSLINDGDPITKADAGYITKKYGWLAPIRPHLYPMQESWRDRNMKPVATVIAKPANRLFVNSGILFSMRVDSTAVPQISIRRTDNAELDEDAIMTWRVHGIKIYRERIVSLLATREPTCIGVGGEEVCSAHVITSRRDTYVEEIVLNGWITLLFL